MNGVASRVKGVKFKPFFFVYSRSVEVVGVFCLDSWLGI